MAYRYPYDEELRKVPLNPEMIRHEIQKCAKRALPVSLSVGFFLTAVCGGFLAIFCSVYEWDSGTVPLIFGILLAAAFTAGMVIGVLFFAGSLRNYRRATRGEIVIETDTLTYVEHDRPRVAYSVRRRHVVYEDFLHFKSGREFKDFDQKYRHLDIDAEEFIVVAYAADRATLLCIYRLSDYNWQE